jgi:putative membrane protein
MVSYNPKEWLHFMFNIRKSDTIRKVSPWLLLLAAYSAGIAWLELEYFHLSDKSLLKNVTVLQTLLGFAISMLLVFRTNSAYDRWWEGRKLWGSLVTNSRILAAKLCAVLPEEDDNNRSFFCQIIPRFAAELKSHLQSEETRLSLDEGPHPEIPNFNRSGHVPLQVAASILQRLQLLYKQEIISGEQLLYLNAESTSLLEICGACERIRNTPIPYSYSAFIKRFILIYVLTLPIGLVLSLSYMVIPVVVVVFYVMAGLEVIAEEIEEPFGKDANDLPMQQLAETIKRNVEELFGTVEA